MLLLYNPQSSANKKPVLPCSLLAVGAVLEAAHEYQIVDGNLEGDPLGRLDELIRQQRSDEPLVVGFTVMPGPQLQQSVPLAAEIKHRHPHVVMVWGGYFPTQHWDACLRSDFVDYVIRGHGEYAFAQLLEGLQSPSGNPQRRQFDYPGLAYRDPAGVPVSNPLAPIPHPQELPSFHFERVPVERYVRKTFLGERTLGYHSSYGCPFFCNFCAVVNMVDGRWLAQSAGQVADVVRLYHERWGVDAVEFYDNNFFVNEKRVAEFARLIRHLGVSWWGEARIDTMLKFSDETWRLMADSGLHMVFLGAESGSDETLRRMNKGGQASAEKTLHIARKMADYGIVPEMSFVLGNPPDPEQDVSDTIAFIRRVKEVNPATEIIMYLYTPVPLAGDLYEQAKAEGFAFPETLDEWVSPEWLNFSQRRSATMPWVKQPLQERLHDFERVLNAYYPTSTDVNLQGNWRRLLKLASAWRYHAGYYRFPFELQAMQKLVAYQRPETSGF
ncbi:MAG: B12-binding domain-containing radical SAM protein [Caldilineales bacterium]|nr:B12-binding domain-containing radical SAM protein [Caldilineales bacterium]